jgi:hypothetical protein
MRTLTTAYHMVDTLSDIQRLSWATVAKVGIRHRKWAARHDGGDSGILGYEWRVMLSTKGHTIGLDLQHESKQAAAWPDARRGLLRKTQSGAFRYKA